jgi:hypothetical protein
VPGGVAAPVETVSAVVPDVVTVEGAKVPVAPEGSPVTLKVTVPVNPLAAVTVAE